MCVRLSLYWGESEGDIVNKSVYRESNLMFTMSSNKDYRIKSLSNSLLLSVNEPLHIKRGDCLKNSVAKFAKALGRSQK